jgi:tetratricopeptide (TPR) repeat protein
VASSRLDSLSRRAFSVYGVTIAAVLAASFFPDVRIWGLNWFSYFGWSGRALLILIGATVPLALTKLTDRDPRSSSNASENRRFLVASLVVTVLFIFVFWLVRARTHFLGDGFLLLERLAEGFQAIRPWNPAVYWTQEWLNERLGASGKESALLAFQLISYTAGLIVMVASALTSLRLFDKFRHRLLFMLGVTSAGYALVFFGYVEHYPMVVAVVATFALMGILIARGKLGRWWILLPLVVSPPLHPFCVAMYPAAVYVLAVNTPVGRWVASWRWWYKIGALLIVAAGAVVLFIRAYETNYFFRFSIVPFVENRFTIEGYTMFSVDHLVDYLNLFWQLQPGLLLLILLAVACFKACRRCPEYRFLAVLAAGSMGIAFLFDPKLGMPRDWDMFSFAGVAPTLLLYLAALDSRWRSTGSLRIAGLAIALSLIMLIPRAATQADPETSIEVFDNYSDMDTFKNGGGRFLLLKYLEDKGRRGDAYRRRLQNATTARFEFWDAEGARLMTQRQYRPAIEKYQELLDDFPCYNNAWTNLGICYYQLRQYDSAIACLRISDGLNPYSVNVYHALALAKYASGNSPEAEELWTEASRLVPTDPRPYTYLLLMYEYDGRDDDYRRTVDRVLEYADSPKATPGLIKQAAALYAKQGDFENSARRCRRILATDADTAYVLSLQKTYPKLKVIEDGR